MANGNGDDKKLVPDPGEMTPEERWRAMRMGAGAAPRIPAARQPMPEPPELMAQPIEYTPPRQVREPGIGMTPEEHEAQRYEELWQKTHPEKKTGWGRFGQIMGTIGQDVGEAVAPGVMERIPGTNAYNRAALSNMTKLLAEDETRKAETGLKGAEAEEARQHGRFFGAETAAKGQWQRAKGTPEETFRPNPDDPSKIQQKWILGENGPAEWVDEEKTPADVMPSTGALPSPTEGAFPTIGGRQQPTPPGALAGAEAEQTGRAAGPAAGTIAPITSAAPTPAPAPARPQAPAPPPARGLKPPDETKIPVGDAGVTQHSNELGTLTGGMTPDERQRFLAAYSVNPRDTHAVATKRLEDAKAAAALSAGERDRALTRQIAIKAHQDQEANREITRGLETVQYRDKKGDMLLGSYDDARAAGGIGIRKAPEGEDKIARAAYTQYGRLVDNAQAASDSMYAWDNPHDKELAIRLKNDFFAHAVIPGVGVDPTYLNTMLNAEDMKQLSPAAQTHMQNMLQLYSDAINLMKAETNGVPRGEQFLQTEGAILPMPEKTQRQNYQAIAQFDKRVRTDSKAYPRPNDMAPLVGVIPPDAISRLRNKQGRVVGYEGADGKDVLF